MNKSEKTLRNEKNREHTTPSSATAGTLMLLSVVITALVVFARLIYGDSAGGGILVACMLLFAAGLEMFHYMTRKRAHIKRQK